MLPSWARAGGALAAPLDGERRNGLKIRLSHQLTPSSCAFQVAGA